MVITTIIHGNGRGDGCSKGYKIILSMVLVMPIAVASIVVLAVEVMVVVGVGGMVRSKWQ